MVFKVKRAKNQECRKIQEVLQKAHKENIKLGFVFPISKSTIKNLRSKMKRDRYYVLKYKEKIIGVVALKKRKKYWEIGSLAVKPKYRRKGLGSKLLRFAEKKAVSLGAKRVLLTTMRKHPTLPFYYMKHGYRPIRKQKKWIHFQKKL
ncbi:GNAT family N-acetyltransferase [Ammoniphilus resinae]|uniref:N-acetylglutamate synthase-like GNAT family acetyltransferase n=1 Tax=Ammoniphilus resinae TaxID=861532 RepID=A0ABS4GL04_9BACL|nr:GNAT family N-acetyltransferase [Ammoniphilus resinae]MBP1930904.1 N-acetylglutamate synthase-like GNAT family acetyltransferase [Ammoniphilus resinae]